MDTRQLFDVSGRVVIVTGGNTGIGRSLALGFADAGASVAIIGRDPEKNEAVLAELEATGNPCMAQQLDLSRREALESAVRSVEQGLGPIDILVNNAGIARISGGILEEDPADWDAVVEIQLNAVFLLSRIVARSMADRAAGKIINLGSMYSYFGSAMAPSYAAAKGGIVQLTRSMAIELAPHGIQVNAIAPGWFITDMTAPIRTGELKAMEDEIMARTPAGRWGHPDELVGTAIFLASAASDFVTGTLLRVDGGYAIR